MKWKRIVLLTCVGGAGLLVFSAGAEGIPARNAMHYSGFLEEGGLPVSGTRSFTIRLFDDASTGVERCESVASGLLVEAGWFRVPLSDACTVAVGQRPDLWVEVQVGTDDPLPRTKLSAVPYAVEANHATSASSSSPGSVLDARLEDTETRLSALETDVEAVEARVEAVEGRRPSVGDYDLDATYCGTTTGTTDGAVLDGYNGLTNVCRTMAPGTCGGRAHVCTATEMLRSVQIADLSGIGWGWIATGTATNFYQPTGGHTINITYDCAGFTRNDGTLSGVRFNGITGPRAISCAVPNPTHCCD